MLTSRWTELRPVGPQQAFWRDRSRFVVLPAGRRSGKTELVKRRLVIDVIANTGGLPPRYFAGAPTRQQAKDIFWADLKALSPHKLVAEVSESELKIKYVNGGELYVLGMDRPARAEGGGWDGCALDEFADMKPEVWGAHIRPALSDRLGWCIFLGVPGGRNHYYDLWQDARELEGWSRHTWHSSLVLPSEEIEAARQDLDELQFKQEYEADFVHFEGRAYYNFTDANLAPLKYDPRQPLVFCFDFNVAPGVAAVCQEQALPNKLEGTGVIGEVHIPRNSNTPRVCRKLIHDWSQHDGDIVVYGDATGGAKGSAKVQGSDWDLIKQEFRGAFKGSVRYKVPQANPKERSRVNAVNSRTKNANGEIRLMVDPRKAPNVVKDFEGVVLLKGGAGEIDKDHDPRLTHLSDGVGYYVHREHPVRSGGVTVETH